MVSQNCSLKICIFSLKQLLTAVLRTKLKIGGLSQLLNGSSSQTLKKTLVEFIKIQNQVLMS